MMYQRTTLLALAIAFSATLSAQSLPGKFEVFRRLLPDIYRQHTEKQRGNAESNRDVTLDSTRQFTFRNGDSILTQRRLYTYPDFNNELIEEIGDAKRFIYQEYSSRSTPYLFEARQSKNPQDVTERSITYYTNNSSLNDSIVTFNSNSGTLLPATRTLYIIRNNRYSESIESVWQVGANVWEPVNRALYDVRNEAKQRNETQGFTYFAGRWDLDWVFYSLPENPAITIIEDNKGNFRSRLELINIPTGKGFGYELIFSDWNTGRQAWQPIFKTISIGGTRILDYSESTIYDANGAPSSALLEQTFFNKDGKKHVEVISRKSLKPEDGNYTVQSKLYYFYKGFRPTSVASADQTLAGARLWPNPVNSDGLWVEAPEGSELRIFDATGRLMLQQSDLPGATPLRINTAGLQQGWYNAVLQRGTQRYTRQIVVE
jgi:hypothetical protein